MALACISREPGTPGEEVALALSRLSGMRNIERDSVEAKLVEFGVGEGTLRNFDEKKPGIIAALSQHRDEYAHYLKRALCEEALKGPCVIVGRGAFAMFRDVPSAFGVLLVAPQEARLARIADSYHCDARHAEHILRHLEADREGFHRFFFNLAWRSPENYHAVLNTEGLDPESIAVMIRTLMDFRVNAETEKAGLARISDLCLSTRIVDELRYRLKLPIQFLEAELAAGAVTLHGVTNAQCTIEDAVKAAGLVPGVTSVRSSIQIIQDFMMMP